jgi:hypothetical protein
MNGEIKMAEQWKVELDEYFMERKKTKNGLEAKKERKRKAIRHFMKKVARPAFEDLVDELKRYKRDCEIDSKKNWAALLVRHNKKKELVYEIKITEVEESLIVGKKIYFPNDKGKLKLGVEGKIQNHRNSPNLDDVEREDIIADFLNSYKDATRL